MPSVCLLPMMMLMTTMHLRGFEKEAWLTPRSCSHRGVGVRRVDLGRQDLCHEGQAAVPRAPEPGALCARCR